MAGRGPKPVGHRPRQRSTGQPLPPVDGEKMPVWHLTLTGEQMREIRLLRGVTNPHARLEQWIWEAIREKAARERVGQADLDLQHATPEELKEIMLQIASMQMSTTMRTIEQPGFMYDVKGMLVLAPDGSPAQDVDQRTKAQAELRQWVKAVREQTGIDAPSRKRVKHTVIHQSILEAAKELGFDTGSDEDQAGDGWHPLPLEAGNGKTE